MIDAITDKHLAASLPDVRSTMTFDGLNGPVNIYRDPWGHPAYQGPEFNGPIFRAGIRDRAGPAVPDGLRPDAMSGQVVGSMRGPAA